MKPYLVTTLFLMLSIFCVGQNTIDAFKIIEAERADTAYKVAVYSDQVGDIDNDDWIAFDSVQFDSVATIVRINLARPEPPENLYKVEIYVDSMNRRNIAGSHIVKDTKVNSGCSGEACWQSFQTQQSILTTPISAGKHKIFLKFKGGPGVANINWFNFTTENATHINEYITFPANGRKYHTNAYVSVTASGTLDKEKIVKIEFYKNDTLLTSDTTLPYSCYTKIENPGSYTLSIKAYDNESVLTATDQAEIVVLDRTEAINAFTRIEAESFNDHSGIGDKGCGPYPKTINFLDGGDWAKYHTIDFGENVNYIELMHSTDFDKPGTILFNIDDLDDEPIGSWLALRTGDWHYYTSKTIPFDTTISGVHDFYIKFQGGSGIGGIDFFNFGYDPTITSTYETKADLSNNISIYPNPVTNHCNILFPGLEKEASYISIYNATGYEVASVLCDKGSQQVQVDCTDFPDGIYLIILNTYRENHVRKFVVKH